MIDAPCQRLGYSIHFDLHDYPSHLYFSKFTQIILLFKKYLLIQLQKHFVEQRMHTPFSHQWKTLPGNSHFPHKDNIFIYDIYNKQKSRRYRFPYRRLLTNIVFNLFPEYFQGLPPTTSRKSRP